MEVFQIPIMGGSISHSIIIENKHRWDGMIIPTFCVSPEYTQPRKVQSKLLLRVQMDTNHNLLLPSLQLGGARILWPMWYLSSNIIQSIGVIIQERDMNYWVHEKEYVNYHNSKIWVR